MTITTNARRIALTVAAATTILTGAAAMSGSAFAAQAPAGHHDATPNGYSPVETCTSLVGSVHLNPGLRKKTHAESVVINGTLDGCNAYGQAQAGQGTFTAILSGNASTTTGQLTGTFTANWPASAGLNPSNGTIGISTTARGSYTMNGSVTSGAFTSAVLQGAYLVTGTQGQGSAKSPITEQDLVNTASFQLLENFG